MAVYDYEHTGRACRLGRVFEHEQPIKDEPLDKCPECGRPVKRLIASPNLSFPKSDSTLKEQGFSKLVRRDQGVYENVTAQDGQTKIVDYNKLK